MTRSAPRDFSDGWLVRYPVREAQDRRHFVREGPNAFQRGLGVERFQGKQSQVEGSVAKRFLEGGYDHKGGWVQERGVLRLAARVQGEVEAHAFFAQFLHHLLLFHKNDLVPSQRKTAADVRANGAGAEGKHFQFAVDVTCRFR